MEVNKVSIIVKDSKDSWEGVRSSLGLLVENMWVRCFIVDCDVELPKDKSKEEFEENLEMLDDLEGEVFSNVQANVDNWEFIQYASMEDIAAKVKEYQLVVPF